MSSPRSFLFKLTGSLSEGAAGNPTGVMVEAAYAHHGLEWRYINMEVPAASLADAIRGARAMGFRGLNCSIPHKVAVIPHLDGLGRSADIMGAVNCVVNHEGRLIGENTDGKGFLRSLETVLNPSGKRIVILGAGGAARAIAVELALAGAAHLAIVNRDSERGNLLVDLLRARTPAHATYHPWSGTFSIPSNADAVIQATCVGLYEPDAAPDIDFTTLRAGIVAADVVFNPVQTRFLREASARGCTALDGLGMLVNQGIIGVKYWTGVEPDAGVMRAALEKAMGV